MLKQWWQQWHGSLISTGIVIGLLIGCRLLGWLQPWEWKALDLAFRSRPVEPVDDRIAIVGLTEADMQQLQSAQIDDATLARLLTKIKAQSPRVIGLDLLRDFPIGSRKAELEAVFRETPNLIGAGKFTQVPGDDFFQPIAAPPILKARNQVGDIGVVVDDDGVVRRGNLYPVTGKDEIASFGLLVAHRYLKPEGINATAAPTGELQLGGVVFPRFEANDGGYIRADDAGYQILLNWRSPPQAFRTISVTEVLENKIPSNLFKNRIVLIGAYAPSLKDYFATPMSRGQRQTPKPVYGVTYHAILISQTISAVLDRRPLLKVWRSPFDGIDYLWIIGWTALSSAIVWRVHQRYPLQMVIVASGVGIGATALLIGTYIIAFWQGWWLPIVPPLLGVWGAATVTLGYSFGLRIHRYQQELRSEVAKQTQSLVQAQQQLIEQEKLALLGRLAAGLSHEIKNALYLLGLSVQAIQFSLANKQEISSEITSQLQTHIDRINLVLDLMLVRVDRSDAKSQLGLIIKNAIDLASQYRGNSNFLDDIELDVAIAPEIETEEIPVILEFPLINLLDNAIYSVISKKKEEIERYQPQIKIEATQEIIEDKLKLLIVVRDNGVGIQPAVKEKLFDAFNTDKPVTDGMGLGLYVSKKFLEQVGAKIKVESKIGQDTKFIIELPKEI
ncbi:MAG: CHASE2 domain-containing protein [Hydrococcus sp. Prado102]|jgi:CHASE2 domain-containing sensor protein|nr:CHASE2 domain-containing protein [Hydrococcus sp. Prado102]